MSLRAFLEGRKRADAASEKLLEAMTALQERMAARLATLMAEMDTVGGLLVNNAANAGRIDEIMFILRDQFNGEEWLDAVSDYLDSFDDISDNVLKYAEVLGGIEAGTIPVMRRQYKALVADYLTSATSFSADLWVPLYQNISGAVVNGQPVVDAIQAQRDLLVGAADGRGAIVGHAHTTVNDLSSIYERNATQVIAEELEIDFFLYQGSEIDTTRPFCDEHRGHVWHRKEIEAWALEEWAGKIPETTEATIFTYLGGYNCRHILVPLARRDVPGGDLARMKAKGLV